MSDFKERKFLHDKGSDFARYLGMPVKVFRRAIEDLDRAALIELKGYIGTRSDKQPDFRIKMLCIQDRLSQLKKNFAPLPTYFMNNAEKLLPKDVYQKIFEAAKVDQENAKKAA